MASAEQVKALLRSHIDGDDEQFYSVAMQMAAHEAKLGHGNLARELRNLIDKAKLLASRTVAGSPVPLARPTGELSGLLAVSYPKLRMIFDAMPRQLNLILLANKRLLDWTGHEGQFGSHPLSGSNYSSCLWHP